MAPVPAVPATTVRTPVRHSTADLPHLTTHPIHTHTHLYIFFIFQRKRVAPVPAVPDASRRPQVKWHITIEYISSLPRIHFLCNYTVNISSSLWRPAQPLYPGHLFCPSSRCLPQSRSSWMSRLKQTRRTSQPKPHPSEEATGSRTNRSKEIQFPM